MSFYGKKSEVPQEPIHSITIQLPDRLHRPLVEKFAQPFRRSVEDTLVFLLEQMASRHPRTATSFEAYAETVREEVLREHARPLALANELTQFIEWNASKAKR